MQLDADEDGEPFFRPPPVPTAPIPKSGDDPLAKGVGGIGGGVEEGGAGEGGEQAQGGVLGGGDGTAEGADEEGSAQAAAAATATVEQEE